MNLAHLNIQSINSLIKRELVGDIPSLEFVPEGTYEACQQGKMKRSSHKSKELAFITQL